MVRATRYGDEDGDLLLDSLASPKRRGRPNLDKDTVGAKRDELLDMLSCYWGEVGWQLPRARTREELQTALKPLKDHLSRHFIARLLLPTSTEATSKDIRKDRKKLEKLVQRLLETQETLRKSAEACRQAESALSQASALQREAVEAQLSTRKMALSQAQSDLDGARHSEQQLREALEDKEAGFAQEQLLLFIEKRFIHGRHARNPWNLANAMIGLPYTIGIHFWTVWYSYNTCSKLKSSLWPHFRFQLFETIEAIWIACKTPDVAPVEFFHQRIEALPKTIKNPDKKRPRLENPVRKHLLDNWRYLRQAISEARKYPIDPARMPFVIFELTSVLQQNSRSIVDIVLADSER